MEEIKNLRETAKRIKEAIEKKEKIILFGDSDLDGAASVLILEETIKNLGGEVSLVYFPDRETEGYGIGERALSFLKPFSGAVLILLDCGISNFKEIEEAKKENFFVIVIDHHEVLDKLPPADLIVNPKQPGDSSPFKVYSTAGLVFKLSEILLEEKMNSILRKNFLELVCLATLADLMPEVEENKEMIRSGLENLENSWRPGIKVFLEIGENQPTSQREFAFKIISALQAARVNDHLNEGYLLLKESDEKKAKELAEILLQESYKKQKKVKEIVQEIERRVAKKIGEPIIFEGDQNWPSFLTGPIASRICNKFQKVTFIFQIGSEESTGAMRAPKNFDGLSLMKSGSEFLLSFGGHPQAAGFRIKNENLEKFKKILIENIKNEKNNSLH
jgi:single-stranded-DNA-specific exonuclease